MTQTRRDFIRLSIAGLSTSSISSVWAADTKKANSTGATRGKKNVLLIIVEDLKAIMGCYGNPLVQTPNIDRLAQKGMIFDRAYCQFPVCNPSRTSFLTGLRPDATRILDNVVSRTTTVKSQTTLPKCFRDHGYYTVGLGKIFHGHAKHDDPDAWDVSADFRPTQQGRQGEGRNLTNDVVKWCRWLAAEGDDNDQPDGQLAQKAVEILRQPRNKPLFMAVGFHKPHDPFHAPKKYFDLYPLQHLMPPVVPDNRQADEKYTIGSQWKLAFDKFTLQDKREFLRSYYACVTFTDAQIGKLLDELDRQNLWADTAVVFIGDHGYTLGEHNWWNKNVLFEDSCRIPMIAVVAGVTIPGVRCNRFVEMVDLYPTFADLCGLTPPANLEGLSFKPLLSQPDTKWKQAAFTQVKRGETMGKSIRTRRWRYTEWRQGQNRIGTELYDHVSDPGEYRNLSELPDFADVCKNLTLLLKNGMNRI